MVRFKPKIRLSLSRVAGAQLGNRLKHKKKITAIHNRKLPEYKPRKQIGADIRDGKGKFKSNETLQKASQKLLMQTMTELNVPVKGKKLFAAVLEAQLGKRFYREKRRDKLRILATGCAVYHELASQLNPKKALG